MENLFKKEDTQIVKGTAIILMVTYHLFAYNNKVNSNIQFVFLSRNAIGYTIAYFGKICVSIYLFLSGFGLFFSYNKLGKFTFKDSIQRIKKVYIDYFIIFVIFISIELLIGLEKLNVYELILNILCLKFNYNNFAWFIRTYFILVLLFPLLIKIFNKNIISNVLKLGGIVITYIFMCKFQYIINYKDISIIGDIKLLNEINTTLLWSIPFILGFLCAKHNIFSYIMNIISKYKLNQKIIYLLIICICIIVRTKAPMVLLYDALVCPIVIFAIRNIFFDLKLNKIITLLGNNSTNIWLIHFFITLKCWKFVYYPKYALLILIWSFIIMIPISIVLNKILNYIKYKSLKNKQII